MPLNDSYFPISTLIGGRCLNKVEVGSE